MAVSRPMAATGHWGARRVQRDFGFVPGDGTLFPSESPALTAASVSRVANQHPSWSWALRYLQGMPDVWLVVPLMGKTVDDQRKESRYLRSTIWTTAMRHGLPITTEWWDNRLWVRLLPK